MNTIYQAKAIVLEKPESVVLSELKLSPVTETDVVVDIEWSGISTGTEKLLWSGRMPHFPGMGYPLVPGYESVGKIYQAGIRSGYQPGQRVFVPGARCFGDVKGLFGGAASRVVVPASRVIGVDNKLGAEAVLGGYRQGVGWYCHQHSQGRECCVCPRSGYCAWYSVCWAGVWRTC